MKIITQNKKAFHDYIILDQLEAGIVLTGDEVKSLRAGKVNLTAAFGVITSGELFLLNCHISAYSHAYQKGSDPERSRKLLVSRKQLTSLIGEVSTRGVTLVPLKLYFNETGRVKVDLAICRHKKAHVRKEELRERDIQRQTRRELSGRYDY